jgi:hypothetical protein
MQHTCERREKCVIFKSVKLKERHHVEDLGADGNLILKCVLN